MTVATVSRADWLDLCLGRLTRLETRIHQLRVILQAEGKEMREYAFQSSGKRAIAAAKTAAATAIELEGLLPQLSAAQEAYENAERQEG